MKCAPGTFSNNGVEPCSPCPVGTYQPGSGQTACLPCPGVKSTHGTGASSDVFCAGQCNGFGNFCCCCDTCVMVSFLTSEVDTCVSNPCMNGGSCVNTKESYRCECARGYKGVNCQNEINECLSSPCYQASTCVNKVF